MYIKRGDNGEIELVSREATADCREFLAGDSPELLAFFGQDGVQRQADELRQSDLEFVRVLEDVINVLMDKSVISFTDLPEPAQQKLLRRQSLRRRVNDVGLFDEDDEGVI
ncbi:tryptophan synthase subunit beta like protein [Billgrantia endophytica]|uniref:Tryptophan synthase subunit beta like protein n=1 Tax=Billgrantia endophytica TaxID=2033802 RepID=A0A2N7U378_9GAMM|nr:tryptophan synthase subunit beta like protein [Halomonas endophytica]PMR74887.1 tryptophan synthase subunit beta like protein [Halomonas endophytica]